MQKVRYISLSWRCENISDGRHIHFDNDQNIVYFRRVMRRNLERPKCQRKISHGVLSVRQLEKKDTPLDKRISGKGKPHRMKSLLPRSKGDERNSKY